MISAQNIIYSDPNTFYTISEIKYYDLSRSKQKIVIRIVRNTDNDIRTLVIFNPQNTIDTLSLPSSDDFKNFSVTLKNTKNGFELKTIWGGGKNIYYDTQIKNFANSAIVSDDSITSFISKKIYNK